MVHLEFEVPDEPGLILTEIASDLIISEDEPDTFTVLSEDNVFVVKRWS